MSIRLLKGDRGGTVLAFPVTATGTKTLPKNIPPGSYKVRTSSAQSFTTAQLVFNSASTATTFGVAVTSGESNTFLLTEECDEVALSTGTFPLILIVETA